ncbi:hypothetical protein Tco_0522345 [Tanacetum coccineum]
MGKRRSKKREKAYEDEKYAAACRYMLSVTCDDEDDYIPLAITTDLPIEEPDNSLNMGDEHLDTIPATESDEVIKSSVENLVPIPSEFEGMSDDTSDVPTCDNNRVNVESDFVESLVNRDTSIVYSSKIDPILEEFADELAHIAPIPPGIVEADPDDDTSSDNDDFGHRSPRIRSSIHSFLDNSLPEFESFSDDTEETRSGSTTTHANYSLPEYESFHFDPSFPLTFLGTTDRTIPSHLPFILFSHLSPTPRPLLYLAPPGVKIRSLTPASPLRAGGISSDGTFNDYPDFEDSRALGTDIKEIDKNKDKTRQNRARDQREHEKTSPRVPSDFIGPARYPLNGPGQPKPNKSPKLISKLKLMTSWARALN